MAWICRQPAEAEIRHVFGDTPITEVSIGAAPPDILVKLSGSDQVNSKKTGTITWPPSLKPN